jgi:hypothetical protein
LAIIFHPGLFARKAVQLFPGIKKVGSALSFPEFELSEFFTARL